MDRDDQRRAYPHHPRIGVMGDEKLARRHGHDRVERTVC
jgi:hypothetical protein